MNRDEIIRMAREAGFTLQRDERLFTEMLERFFHAAYAAGAAAERKAIEPIVFGLCISDNNAQEIVDAIRKRNAKT